MRANWKREEGEEKQEEEKKGGKEGKGRKGRERGKELVIVISDSDVECNDGR